jgi:hypothetical protein
MQMKFIALAVCGYAVVLALPSPVNAEVGLGTACQIKCAEMKVTCERIKTSADRNRCEGSVRRCVRRCRVKYGSL